MDCLLKVIKGVESGMDFRASAGETVLGRSPRAHFRLTHPSVSFEHAVIIRNGDDYYVENLSSTGTLLNNTRIIGRIKLRAKDEIQLGPDTLIRVESTPGSSAPVHKRKLLIYATIALMAFVLFILVADPFGESTDSFHWTTAYNQLLPFAQAEAASGNLPPEIPNLLREAWRSERAGDKKGAGKWYLRLQILLAKTNEKSQILQASNDYPHALESLANADPKSAPPDHDHLAAALHQFVQRRLNVTSPRKE